MTIYRGPGGGGNADSDAEVNQLAAFALEAENSAIAAAASAAAAAGSEADAIAAAASAAAALVSENAAASSAASALSSKNSAETAKTAAELAETNAETAQTAAQLAETNAETAETNAAASAVSAASSASTATTQAGLASTSASNAATSESNAATSASGASTSASNAASSASSAAASYDSFDDRYLGAKSADPTLDNDGNALLTGALYWNTVSNQMRVYSGSVWIVSYLPADGYVQKTGDTMTGALNVAVNTSSNALRITQTGTGNALLVEDSTNPDATPFVIDASGNVIVGSTAPVVGATSYTPPLQVSTGDTNSSGIGLNAFSAGTGSSFVQFNRSKSSTIGSNAAVVNGELLGNVRFSGADGTGYVAAALITGQVDGTPGTNDMPGRLVFSTTADGASAPTERMRINSAGNVGIGKTPTTALDVNGTVSATSITDSGNLAFTGTGNRITGDFSNGTIASRVLLQSSTTNGQSALGLLPNGTSTQTQYIAFNSTDPANSSYVQTLISATEARINSGQLGTGTNLPMTFYTGGSERVRVDTSGNVGIGTSTVDAKLLVDSSVNFDPLLARTTPAILARGTGTAGAGAYGGAISFSQINSSRPWGAISGVQQGADVDQGGLAFFVHGSTSTNDQTQEVVRIDSSGNVGIGTSSPATKLHVAGGSAIARIDRTADASANPELQLSAVARQFNVGVGGATFATAAIQGAYYIYDSTAAAYRMVINSSGNVGIGKTPSDKVLELYSASNTAIRIQNSTTGTATSDGLLIEQSGVDAQIVNYEAGALKFFTSGTERARIDSSGNLLVNQTSQTGAEKVGISFDRAGSWGLAIKNTSSTAPNNATYVQFYYASTNTGGINSTGTTTSYATTSDYRLKEAIAPMTGALAKVVALKPVTYKWKSTGESDEGFIAHELQEVCPSAVTGEKDATDAEGNPQYQGIDTSFLVATLTAAIQELKAIVDAQGAEIAELKAI